MDSLWQDVRFGWRMLWKSRGFTAVAVLVLGLGIGANTAIFSVINAVLLRPLPFAEPERLVMVWGTRPGRERDTVTPANFLDWRGQSQVFEELAALSYVSLNLVGEGDPERVRGASVSTNFFRLLGRDASVGRVFAGEGDLAETSKVVVLSNGLWRRRFGGDPSVVGRTVTLNSQSYRVLGVMPADFNWPLITPSSDPAEADAELWTPAAHRDVPQFGSDADRDVSASRSASYMRVVGRLKPGVTLEQAQAEMETVAARLAEAYPEVNTGKSVNLIPLHRQIVGDVRPALFVLFAAVVFVLAIACANVANLLLARTGARRREIAVRMALGAGRGRLMRQLLVESVLLGACAGGVGLLLAVWGADALVGISPARLPRFDQVSIDGRVLLFTLSISLGTGLLFGLLPAAQASRANLSEALKEGGGKTTGGRSRSRSLFMVAEVALALVLLIAAGLLLKSFLLLREVKPGFDAANLLTMKLSLPEAKYPDSKRRAAAFRQALENISAVPGVRDVGAVSSLPFAGDDISFPLTIDGRPAPPPGQEIIAGYQVASPDYFRAMRIPLLRGRDFTEADTEGKPGVAIVNETTANLHWPGGDPLGKRVKLGGAGEPWLTVVGVVADVRHSDLAAGPRAEAYVSYLQSPFSFTNVVVRSDGDPLMLVQGVRGAVARVDPAVPVAEVRAMESLLADSVAQPRFVSLLVGVFSALALALAGVGIYGVLSYTVAQRTREIGIRMALGAQRGDVLKMVMRQGMTLVLAGVAAGCGAAYALTRLLGSLLFGVSATDPAVFVAVSLLLALVALLACLVPARRATKVDPMVALRYE